MFFEHLHISRVILGLVSYFFSKIATNITSENGGASFWESKMSNSLNEAPCEQLVEVAGDRALQQLLKTPM